MFKVLRFRPMLACVFGFSLLLLACKPLFNCSFDQSELAIGIKLPDTVSSSLPVALRQSLAAQRGLAPETGRFIHPGASKLSVILTLDGVEQPAYVVPAFDPANSGTIELPGIPVGASCSVAVSISDADGLLCSGQSDVFTVGSGINTLSIVLLPLVSTPMLAGPAGTEDTGGNTRGAAIDGSDAGQLQVFSVSLPAAGPYFLTFSDYDAEQFYSLYNPDGRLVPLNALSSTTYSFTAPAAGTWYVAVDVPVDYSWNAELGIDADSRVYYSGPSVYVDADTGDIMDRQRSFELTIPCGYLADPGPIVTVEESLPVTALVDTHTFMVSPGVSGIGSQVSGTNVVKVSYTDALLGIERFDEYVVDLPAPRTVLYTSSSGGMPADSVATAELSLSSAASKVPISESGVPVILMQAGDTLEESAVIYLSGDSALLVGGCDSNWERKADFRAKTLVNLPLLTPPLINIIPASPSSFLIDSIDFQTLEEIGISAPSVSLVNIGAASGPVFIRNSSFRFGGFRNNYGSVASVSLLESLSTSTLSLDRTEISSTHFIDDTAEFDVFGINSSSAMTSFRMTNSLVSLGNISPSFSNSETRAISIISSLVPVTIVGSTVSAGVYQTLPGNITTSGIYAPSTNLILANTLIVVDTRMQNNWAIRVHETRLGYVRNNLIATVSPIDLATERFLQRTNNLTAYYWADFQAAFTTANTNYCLSLDGLGMEYSDPALSSYMRPTAASPASLLYGGANMGSDTVLTGYGLSTTLKSLLGLDRDGTQRTGSGSSGYTIGAYEID